jgi:hypothetical protein
MLNLLPRTGFNVNPFRASRATRCMPNENRFSGLSLRCRATAQRTLLEDGRWNPMNGYGFRKILNRGVWGAPSEPLDFEIPESEILVLKLHGSVGWHRTPGGIWNHLESEERELANHAVAARERFRECLNQYFLYKHYLDSKSENKASRSYLRKVLSTLTGRVPTGVSVFPETAAWAGDAVNLVSSSQSFGRGAIGGDLGI